MASRNSAYARKVEKEARKNFRDDAGGSAFEFETVIGGGMAGVTFRFLERPGAGSTMTRARAAAPQQLRWSAHIVNLGALDSNPWVGQPYMVLKFLP
ncbi:hypothetical protein DL770_010083 [Monosporascus sp. CRB-9-2]|nr:hypothetical protein DL770_010083 [Monosporascus sp. CRB-9-2]